MCLFILFTFQLLKVGYVEFIIYLLFITQYLTEFTISVATHCLIAHYIYIYFHFKANTYQPLNHFTMIISYTIVISTAVPRDTCYLNISLISHNEDLIDMVIHVTKHQSHDQSCSMQLLHFVIDKQYQITLHTLHYEPLKEYNSNHSMMSLNIGRRIINT